MKVLIALMLLSVVAFASAGVVGLGLGGGVVSAGGVVAAPGAIVAGPSTVVGAAPLGLGVAGLGLGLGVGHGGVLVG